MYDRSRDPQIDHAASDPDWIWEEMTAAQRARAISDMEEQGVYYDDRDHYDRKVGT